jgi:formylglycine-generating enzyme required for sulfatase activity
MKTIISVIRLLVLILLVVTNLVAPTLAQEVSIPDPGLNAAIREALQKPSGPLTEQDLLSLTDLSAESRNISNLQGLDAAHNLRTLDLHSNHLTNVSFPSGLTNLNLLDLSSNPLTSLALSDDMTNLTVLKLFSDQLTDLTLPGELRSLTTIDLEKNQLTTLTVPAELTSLIALDLENNLLTSLNLPSTLTHLDFLDVAGNQLTNLTLPAGLTSLTELDLWGNQLTSLTLPADMTNLIGLSLFFNQLTDLILPANLRTLGGLSLAGNRLSSFNVSSNLTSLATLDLSGNQLTNVMLSAGLTNLDFLNLAQNQLTNLTLPAGLTKLTFLDLRDNQLSSLTLSPDMRQLTSLFLAGDPFATLVLSEPSAATSLAGVVAALRNQGVSVFTYPLVARLLSPRGPLAGSFEFTLTGPPGIYSVQSSTNLATWSDLGMATNMLGSIVFTDVEAGLSRQKFYRALLQSAPANMVFIPPNTFTMGSPDSEQDRNINEGPQTTVTLNHGFWIGKYEVTQGEYLSVMNTNPSVFLGDLSRPVSSVSWPDATNYCAKLTQRELAAGRIPPGSQYRLPTEAEWECAARAGTLTRFSYGDDPDYSSLANHAWFAPNADLTVHPVGQKLPNSWGLYDMEGNVWEWCQDWLGELSGGAVIDPTGPPSNPIGWKVIRGGGYDFGESDCRSARRDFFGSHPALTDSDLGFRVVLSTN